MDLGLKNKVVLVTGSSRGLGKVIAGQYLREGARVCLTARGQEALAQTENELRSHHEQGEVSSLSADLTREEDIERCVRFVSDHYGCLDILVANAGLSSGRTGTDLSKKEWLDLLEINLISPALLIDRLRPLLKKSQGAIVLISSIAGREALPAPLPYSVAKLGLAGVNKNMSRLLARDRIRINTVCPGNILLPGGAWERKLKENKKDVENYIGSEVPMQRFATGQEVADAVLFLSSERTSFVTGATLVVDGGQTRGLL